MARVVHAAEYSVPEEKAVFFERNGFVVLDDVVGAAEVARYRRVMEDMLAGRIATGDKRGDLGGHTSRIDPGVENCVQISHPYALTSALDECELFRKGRDICNQLFRDSAFALDCAQLLVKMPRTATETPWHQDQSYYPDLTDDRAANVWCALDDCTVESGCLRFHPTPLGARRLSAHRAAGNGRGALTCDPPAREPVSCPVRAGSVCVFANYTYHYGGPNNSDRRRAAFVAQYRPAPMVQAARAVGFDHGKFRANDGDERTAERLKLRPAEPGAGAPKL